MNTKYSGFFLYLINRLSDELKELLGTEFVMLMV